MSIYVMMITMRLSFMFWLIVCTNMFMLKAKRRKYFLLRLCVTSAAELGLSALIGWTGLEIMFAAMSAGIYDALFNSLLNLAVHYIIYGISIGGLFICYSERPVSLLYGSIAGYAANNIAAVLNNMLTAVIPGTKFFSLDPIQVPGVLLWLACNVAVPAAIYFLFVRPVNGVTNTAELNSRSTLILFAVMIVVSVTVRSFSSYYGSKSLVLFLSLCITLICCNIIVLYVQFLLSKKLNERKELEKIVMIGEIKKRQYELTKENIDIINMKCHDLRHQILSLEYGKVGKDYLKDLGRSVNIYGSYMQTGNEALDVVLTDKNLQCSARGITLTAIADGSLLSFMRPDDVYSLFGNALENAVEYVAALPPEKRMVKLFVEKAWKGGFVSIRIWNSYEGDPPEMRGGLPVSSKGDDTVHGYGVKSMKKIAESYGGDFNITVGGGGFLVCILIPLK